jgi:hypothetical protein
MKIMDAVRMRGIYPGKKLFRFLLLAILMTAGVATAEELYRPYILSSNVKGDLVKTIIEVKEALLGQGFELAGEYTPYPDAHVLVVTSSQQKGIARLDSNGAFLLGQRVSITRVGESVQVAYTNPEYFGFAYRVKFDMGPVRDSMEEVLGRQESFGGEGLAAAELEAYHYSYGMEYFNDFLELGSFPDHEIALGAVEGALDDGKGGIREVYRVDLPKQQLSVFGISLTGDDSGDRQIMDPISYGLLKPTPVLPYEIVVQQGRVFALHPRFRLAIYFPDTRWALKLKGLPAAIERSLEQLTAGD